MCNVPFFYLQVLSFISIIMFALLFFIMLYGGCMIKVKGRTNSTSNFASHPQDEPYMSYQLTHLSPYQTTNVADTPTTLPSVTDPIGTPASIPQRIPPCARPCPAVDPIVQESKTAPLYVLDEPPAYEFEDLPTYESVVVPYNELILETPL